MEKMTEPNQGDLKTLIVFYSWSGNTREVAGQIKRANDGHVVELEPTDPYPQDYNAVVSQAKRELTSGFKPALKTKVDNVESYDIIFIGSPNWWSTVAPPVRSFLSECDLSGKTIAPFVTHGGGGLGRCVTDIAALCPRSTVLDSLVLSGANVKTAQNMVAEWVDGIRKEAAAD